MLKHDEYVKKRDETLGKISSGEIPGYGDAHGMLHEVKSDMANLSRSLCMRHAFWIAIATVRRDLLCGPLTACRHYVCDVVMVRVQSHTAILAPMHTCIIADHLYPSLTRRCA